MVPNALLPTSSVATTVTRVLIADDDPLVRRVVSIALAKAGLQPVLARDGHEALALLTQPDAPRLAVIDWVMPGLDGIDACRLLRQKPGGASTYIFLVSSRQSEEDVLAGFDAGVDDFIAKPFDLSVLVARLLAVKRRLEQDASGGTQDVVRLLQSITPESNGEIVVRSQEQVGRVLIHQGKVAWVQLSNGMTLKQLLSRLGISEDDARLVLEECRTKKLPFKDTLVQWALVDQERLRASFQEEFSRRLRIMVAMPATLAFFVPGEQSFLSGFSYALAELEPFTPGTRLMLSEPVEMPHLSEPPASVEMDEALAELNSIDGLLSALIIDRHSGLTLSSIGMVADHGLLHHKIRLFNAEDGEPAEELLLFSTTRLHFMRGLPNHRLLCVSFQRALNPNIALVRLLVSEWQQKHASTSQRVFF